MPGHICFQGVEVKLVIMLSLALLLAGIWEKIRQERNLKRVPLRILVNGTRGKSSVTRLIYGALREAGFHVVAKTTGSEACMLHPDGSETVFPRPHGARITELERFFRMAVDEHADAAVVECLAVHPQAQWEVERHLVKAPFVVITNARIDHVGEMGPSMQETLDALAMTIPEKGVLFTLESWFKSYADDKVRVVVPDCSDVQMPRFAYPEFPENVALALSVTRHLGIPDKIALCGMQSVKPDVGVLSLSRRQGCVFINAFAANDWFSTLSVWEKAETTDGHVVVVYNNRADREYRLPLFRKGLSAFPQCEAVIVIGEHTKKVARYFKKLLAVPVHAYPEKKPMDDLPTDAKELFPEGDVILFGVGNIKGRGRELLQWMGGGHVA